MLRLTVSPEEYLLINGNVKIIFLGGSKNNLRIMVEAPKEVNIVRSAALEARAAGGDKEGMPKYYAVPDTPKKYRGSKPR